MKTIFKNSESRHIVECSSIHTNIVKYIDCPECSGEGQQMVARMYPSGHTEVWEDCEFCNSEGSFEESDYLIMKLEGRV